MFCWHFLSLFDLPHVSLPLISYDYLSNIRWNFSGVLTSFFQILSEALLVLADLIWAGCIAESLCLFVGIPIVHHTWDTGGGGGFTQIPTFRPNNALAPALVTMFTVVACTLLE